MTKSPKVSWVGKALPLLAIITIVPISLHAQTFISNTPFQVKLKGEGQARTVTSKTKVAIAGYNIASFTEAKVTARSNGLLGGSGARATMAFSQTGITPEIISEIATAGYEDLVAQMEAAGLQVVPMDTVKSHPNSGSGGIGTYDRQGSFFGNDFILRGPRNLGGTGYFALGAGFYNANSFAKVSSDNDAILVFNNLTLNFVDLQSSGNQMLSNRASVGGTPKFILEPYALSSVTYSRDGRYMDGAYNFRLERLVIDEPFASMENVRNTNNNLGVLVSAAMGVGMASTSRRDNVVAVDPERFKALALSAARGYNTALVEKLTAMRGTAP
jgi:hypothetical protein